MKFLTRFKKKTVAPIRVEIYSKPDCHLCDDAKAVIDGQKEAFDLDIRLINIEDDPGLFEKYRYDIPVIWINGRKAFKYRIDSKKLIERLRREH